MEAQPDGPFYWVWGVDNVAYGPVELPTLVAWLKAGRVLADSWVFQHSEGCWRQAAEILELKPLLDRKSGGSAQPEGAPTETISPALLRQIKVFAGMDEAQLQSFLSYMDLQRFSQFTPVVHKDEYGDAMYLVLEGELRAFSMIDGKETTLFTLGVGEFFGEMALLDHGPRSATVTANADCVLLRICAASFDRLLREAPSLAALFIHSLSRSIVARMRLLNRKYEDSIHWSRTATGKS